jgi:hypothetical protein
MQETSYPYGLKTSTEATKKRYPGFPTIYEQKVSSHAGDLECCSEQKYIGSLNRRFSVQRNDPDRGY